MSTLKVEIVSIHSVLKHPNADRLDVVEVKGWRCICQKDAFKTGDKGLYFPIDSILPNEVELRIFGPNSKVRLHNSRVKTIKLRKVISQGLLVSPSLFDLQDQPVGKDLTKKLKVTKYEPLQKSGGFKAGNAKPIRLRNPLFKKYTDIDNYKNFPQIFTEGEQVSITEKIHGSNWRAGILKSSANTLWKKVKKLFGLLPEYEFVYGSHNVQKQELACNKRKGFYGKDIYVEMVEKYNIKEILKPGIVLYGEVYGDGIQKNYTYGCKEGEHKLVIFDITYNGRYIDSDQMFDFCKNAKLPTVPELYKGPFTIERVVELTKGHSALIPQQKVREGVVIKSVPETIHPLIGRKVLKYLSDKYLLQKDNTDFH